MIVQIAKPIVETACLVLIGFAAIFSFSNLAMAQVDELQTDQTWTPPKNELVIASFAAWLDEEKAENKDELVEHLKTKLDARDGKDILDIIIASIEKTRPDIRDLHVSSRKPRVGIKKPDFSKLLDNKAESDFVKNHMRLLHARWLAQNDLYDEAIDEFKQLKLDNVLDPATLLFYRGVTEHQLLKKAECVKTMDQLLEHEERLPRRYAMVGKMILADMSALKPDSMDEISRMMADIRRRQSLYRAGKIVRTEEQDVIKKLDKLIEQLEKQQQQQQQQSGNSNPSQPMQDSQNAAGRGTGEVAGKQQIEGGDWGNLPPAERASALAEMAKDLPPHYRAVIEEYFRKLAQDDKNN